MKVLKRVLRILLGLLLLAVFCFGFSRFYAVAPKSLTADMQPRPTQALRYLEPEESAEPTPQPPAEPTPTPTPVPTVDPESPAGRAEALGLPTPPEIDAASWEFILANGDNSIGEYVPENLTQLEGQSFDGRVIDALTALIDDSRAAGYSVYVSSGYRSYGDQAANFTRICQNNGVADGKNSKGFYITMPAGCSEHQTGLCCDLTDRYYETKTSEALEKTALFQYMSQHCHEFGFILRFPADKEEITGVMYEPWHYRYVGMEAAAYITENHLCLEEFLALYQ